MQGKAIYFRDGWTRLDLVTTIVTGTVLSAIFAIGILHMRAAARHAQCSANLRQIGQAIQTYHVLYGALPPAAILRSATQRHLRNVNSRGQPYVLSDVSASWTVMLLPHLDVDAPRAGSDVTNYTPVNATLHATGVGLFRCAEDSYALNDYRAVFSDGSVSVFARGNYAMNGGVGGNLKGVEDWPGNAWAPVADGMVRRILPDGREQAWGSGIGGFNKSFSVRDFRNGLSNLVAIEEVRAGITPDDSRGVWALGEVGSSITWWHGLLGDATGPNSRQPRSDDIVGCNQLHELYGEAELVAMGMPCCSYTSAAGQATARSMHPGGVNALMLDGATRFYSDNVDGNVWHAVHSRLPPDVEVASIQPPPIERAAQFRTEPRYSVNSSPVINSVGMTLVHVPAGEFVMGLPDEGQNHDTPVTGVPTEAPPHTVRFSRPFLMSAYEITHSQYSRVVGNNPSWHLPLATKGELPVERVSWHDAIDFCNRLSSVPEEKQSNRMYRLPTEAEWEYCSRAGSRTPFRLPHGDDGTGFNVLVSPQHGKALASVGSYRPNDFGLYDMHGNVWEWCQDWYARDYYSQSPLDNPQGPESGVLKVVRGSDWRFTGMGCKYARFHAEPWRKNRFIGFRVVCELAQGTPYE